MGYSRFAVNVPVSVSKKATVRNRLRRIVYDEIGQACPECSRRAKPAGSVDCLIGVYQKQDEKILRAKIKKICVSI